MVGTLLRLAQAVDAASTLSDVHDAALDCVRDALAIERASIQLANSDGVMRLAAWRGLSPDFRAGMDGYAPWTDGDVHSPVLVPDVRADPALERFRPAFEREGIEALIIVPLVSQGGVAGALTLYRPRPHSPSAEEIDVARTIGHHVGVAIDRLRGAEERALSPGSDAALAEESTPRQQMTQLTLGAQRLLTSLTLDAIVTEVLTLAERVLTADGYAVWRRDGTGWRISASAGLSPAFSADRREYTAQIPFDEPIVIEDVMVPRGTPEARIEAYRREGIRSITAVPLIIRGAVAGGVALYYRTPHRSSDIELRAAEALGHMATAAIRNAELYAEQQAVRAQAQRSAERAALLVEASALLSSLDYEENLRRVAQLSVPRLADWCAVDLLDDRDSIRRIAIAHVDPARVAFARDLQERYPTTIDQPQGVGHVIRTGTPELIPDIPESVIAALPDPERRRLIRELEIRSVMIVPLSARGRTFGAILFVSTNDARHYQQADMDFAMELARRAALAIDNARLFKEAQDANRLKDEFLATLSHELRTPLNVILGRTKMLQAVAAEPGAVRAAADTIGRNGATLARLVDDLLDVSRITVGQIRLDADPIQLADVLDAVLQGVQPAAVAKGITLRLTRGAAVPEIVGDTTRLQQVIWNLLTNAVKFTPAGGEIEIGLAATDSDVVLTVSDTGQGIEPEFLPHVFEMFRRGEPSTERRHPGLGLGLSIVKRLVELHGGRVSAQSRGPGEGATFVVKLPRPTAARGATGGPSRAAQPA